MSKITCPNCGCDYETSAVPSVKVQEEKQHDTIGRSVHAAGNVGMCNCDTCRLPTRNLLEIGSIPNVTTGQPQRVFVEWSSSAISVPAVPVQDAPAPICKDCLLHTSGELTWLEYCPKHQPFPAVQGSLTTLADRIQKELKLWGGPHPLITLLNESEAALRRAAGKSKVSGCWSGCEGECGDSNSHKYLRRGAGDKL